MRYGMEVISQKAETPRRHEGTQRIPTTMWLVGAVRDRSRGVYGAIRPQP
jgi:hypothetical protein